MGQGYSSICFVALLLHVLYEAWHIVEGCDSVRIDNHAECFL
jgi:hypothetical protein